MSRPELMELKAAIENLKRDAEIRLTLDVEAQQSFEFLSDQINGLRRAFSTLSDVLIEEVDLMRSDSSGARSDLEDNVTWLMKTCRATRAELTLLRTQFEATRQDLNSRVEALEDRLDGMGQDATLLAQEVANGKASQHLLQLEIVELRSSLEREARERRDGHAAHEARIAGLSSGFEAHWSQTQETLGALDEDLGSLRQYAAGHIGAHAGAQVELRQKLQLVGEAVEDQNRQARAQQQQIEGLSQAAGLRSQQLQVRAASQCVAVEWRRDVTARAGLARLGFGKSCAPLRLLPRSEAPSPLPGPSLALRRSASTPCPSSTRRPAPPWTTRSSRSAQTCSCCRRTCGRWRRVPRARRPRRGGRWRMQRRRRDGSATRWGARSTRWPTR